MALELAVLFPPTTYVVGGLDEAGEALATAECLDESGEWTPIAPLNVARSGSVAAALSGRVIVAGGWGGDGEALASAEAYDPKRGRWSLAPWLREPRAEAAAAVATPTSASSWAPGSGSSLAAPQLVLISGVCGHGTAASSEGEGEGAPDGEPRRRSAQAMAAQSLASVEFLDASAQTWLPGPPCRFARRAAAAASLGSHIFLLGGFDNSGSAMSDVEVLDLSHLGRRRGAAATWAPAPRLQEARSWAAATSVLGYVYVVGGAADGVRDLASVERYALGAQAWERLESLTIPRRAACAVSVSGRVLVLGGVIGEDAADVAAVCHFDPRARAWEPVWHPSFVSSRRYFAAAACRSLDDAGAASSGTELKCVIS